MPPSGFEGVRRVLAVRLDNVADVVLTAPALRSLRRALPDAHLTLMTSAAGSHAAPLLPWVDDVWTLREIWQDVSGDLPLAPARELDLVARMHARRFDAAIIFTSFAQSPFPPADVCYLAGIPIRAGQSKKFGGGILSHVLLRRPTDCSPCYRFECPFDLRCLDVDPEEVVAATLGLLREESCVPFAS